MCCWRWEKTPAHCREERRQSSPTRNGRFPGYLSYPEFLQNRWRIVEPIYAIGWYRMAIWCGKWWYSREFSELGPLEYLGEHSFGLLAHTPNGSKWQTSSEHGHSRWIPAMRLVSRSICYEYTGWKLLQKPCALMEDLYLPAAGARCQLMLISFTCPSVMKMVRLYQIYDDIYVVYM